MKHDPSGDSQINNTAILTHGPNVLFYDVTDLFHEVKTLDTRVRVLRFFSLSVPGSMTQYLGQAYELMAADGMQKLAEIFVM